MIIREVKIMENAHTNGSKNGAKPRSKKPKEKQIYTEAEMELIKTSRAVMKVIQKQLERGDFDEYLKKEESKI